VEGTQARMIPKDCKRHMGSCPVAWIEERPPAFAAGLLGILPRIAYQSEAAAMIFSKRRKCEPAQ
jgi:hypothetical protein